MDLEATMDEQQEILRQYWPWLRATSRSMLGTTADQHSRIDDLCQEGWIAMWDNGLKVRTQDTDLFHSDDPNVAPLDYWLKHVARCRMLSVLRHWNTKQQKAHSWVAEPPEPTYSQGLLGLAYHRSEIIAAIAALSPREREYVILRFWNGWQPKQFAEHFGRGYRAADWWNKAQSKLVAALVHLAPNAPLGTKGTLPVVRLSGGQPKGVCVRGHKLVAPNLVTSANYKKCLACTRGWATVNDARRRLGTRLDIVVESNRHYEKIADTEWGLKDGH